MAIALHAACGSECLNLLSGLCFGEHGIIE
jgi:hypothetical protein